MTIAGWTGSDLASLVTTLESGSRPKGGASADTGEVASLGGENIRQSGGLTLAEVKRVPYAFFKRMSKGHLADGDVLINKDGAQTGKVAVYLEDGAGFACINEHLFLIRGDKEQIRQDFLYYTLLSERGQRQIAAQISGSAQPGLKSSFLGGVVTDVPNSLLEQAKIAEILSTVDGAIEQAEALIAKKKRITTGLMQGLLTRGIDEQGKVRSEQTRKFKDSSLGRIPIDWEVLLLGDVAEIIDPNPSHRYPPPCDVGVPIASTENFEDDNDFDLKGCEFVPRSVFEAQSKRCRYQPVDIVFARKGRLGFARPYGNAEKVFSHTVVIIKARSTRRAFTEFLLWVLRDEQFFGEIAVRMNSNSGVPTLGVKFLAAIPILVPKPAEQRRVVQVLSQSEEAVQREQSSLRKLRSLKTALMQDLLTGKERVTRLLESEPKREEMYAHS